MTKKLSAQRARELLESYGGRPELWPASERAALRDYLASVDTGDSIHAVLAQESALDNYLDQVAPNPVISNNEVMQLQKSVLNRIEATAQRNSPVTPGSARGFLQVLLRPAWSTALATGLAVAIAVGVYWNHDGDPGNVNQATFEAWAWSEITGTNTNRDLIASNTTRKSSQSTLGAIAQFEPDLEVDDF